MKIFLLVLVMTWGLAVSVASAEDAAGIQYSSKLPTATGKAEPSKPIKQASTYSPSQETALKDPPPVSTTPRYQPQASNAKNKALQPPVPSEAGNAAVNKTQPQAGYINLQAPAQESSQEWLVVIILVGVVFGAALGLVLWRRKHPLSDKR